MDSTNIMEAIEHIAFPTPSEAYSHGMTKLDYFAAAALTGLLATGECQNMAADRAYTIAVKMFAARQETLAYLYKRAAILREEGK